MTDGNHYAFPVVHDVDFSGLTKREYFAALIMAKLAESVLHTENADRHRRNFAGEAVDCADALIAALNARKP